MEKFKKIIVGLVFVGVGLLIIYLGGVMEKEQKEFKKNARKTTAYVEDVKTETERKRYRRNGRTKYRTETKYIAYVSYEVDGRQYTNVRLESGASGFSEGSNITIYYNSKKPNDIATNIPNPAGTKTMMTILGLVFVGAGALLLYNEIKNNGGIPSITIGGRT